MRSKIDSRPPSTTGLESHCSTTRSVEPNKHPSRARADTDMQGLYVASLSAFSKSLASCWKTNSCLIMITPNMNWPLRTLSQWVSGLPPLHLPLTNGRMSPLVEACCKRPKRRHAFWMQLPAVADEFKVFRVRRRVARPEITAT